MRPLCLAFLFTVLCTPFAKGQTGYLDPAYIPRVDVAVGYTGVRSNAPPDTCDCFTTGGGFASVGVPIKPWVGAAAELTRSHSTNIGPLGQNLTLTTFTAGPRLVYRASRYRAFVQVLAGVAHGSDSYFPSTNTYSTQATSFTYSVGGGVDYHLSRALDLRPLQLQYLHTGFPNGSDNSQNHVMFGAGIVIKLKGQLWMP